MQILLATLDDARAVAEIHVATWRDAYRGIVPTEHFVTKTVESREAMWRETIIKGTSQLYVAKKDSIVVGWVSFGSSRDPGATKLDGEIWAIYVASAHWSSGVGKALWLKARSLLKEQGYKRISVGVHEEKTARNSFIIRRAFQLNPLPKKKLSCRENLKRNLLGD